MTHKAPKAIGVASPADERPLSKSQKAFNALTEKIAIRRASLAEWEVFGADFERRYAGEFVPLFDRFHALRRDLVHCLDRAYDTKGLTKGDRQTMAELIGIIAGELLESFDDPAIEEIYDRYLPRDAEVEAAALGDLREALETTFGVTLGDDVDIASPEDLLRHVNEQLEQMDEAELKRREAKEAHQAKRKSSAKQKAAEERARAEEEEVHLSLRVVYRKLASALHPDRESDPVERERKAALMQRVNIAYGKRSLLDLLEIQLDLEHIDQQALDSVSDDRLKRWNIILKDQLHDLDGELADVKQGYAIRCGMMPGATVSPKSVKRKLSTSITALGNDIRVFERDVRMFNEGRGIKEWVREMKWMLARDLF